MTEGEFTIQTMAKAAKEGRVSIIIDHFSDDNADGLSEAMEINSLGTDDSSSANSLLSVSSHNDVYNTETVSLKSIVKPFERPFYFLFFPTCLGVRQAVIPLNMH